MLQPMALASSPLALVAIGIGTLLACATGVTAAGAGPSAAGGPGGAAEPASLLRIELDGALPDGRGLTVYVHARGEHGFGDALAVSPRFNRTAHGVDAGGLRRHGDGLRGELRITLRSDGYNPPPGRPATARYRIDATLRDGRLDGRFEGGYKVGVDGDEQAVAGAVRGEVSPPAKPGRRMLLDIEMANAAGDEDLTGSVWARRGLLRIGLVDGRVVYAGMRGHGDGSQVNYFEAIVTDVQLQPGQGPLTGSVSVRQTGGDEYAFHFDGTIVGDQAGGTFSKRVNGREAPGGSFRGTFTALAEAPVDDAIYNIELLGAVEGGRQLNIYLPRSGGGAGGGFGDGVAYSGRWNHMFHDVDASGLVMGEDGHIRGELAVTMNPDAYVPDDGRPVAARYRIDARGVHGFVSGRFEGRFGEEAVEGGLIGRIDAAPARPEPARFNLKLEDGVNEGAPWLRRVYVSFTTTDGEADEGSMSNNKGGWTGRFQSATTRFDGDAFHATIRGTVDTSRGPRTGDYRFELRGRAIGHILIGRVETWRNGERTKGDTPFMGAVQPAPTAADAD